MRLALTRHPDTPSAAIERIEVQVRRLGLATLDLHYFAHGRVHDVRWPEAAAPERGDRLWETSCFEAFVRAAGRKPYAEFNFSPSGQWQAYRFNEYRAGMAQARGLATPDTNTRMTAQTRVHHVSVALEGMAGLAADANWRVGLSAVIEDANGAKSYWALAHPAGKPDFHHDDCFALTLLAARML